MIGRSGSAERVITCGATRAADAADDEILALRLLDACRTAFGHCLEAEMRERPLVDGNGALLRYLRLFPRFQEIECARLLHLDVRNRLILDELVSEGSVHQAQIHPREVVRRTLELGSAAIILVHNHPSGDPRPSRQNLQLPRKLAEAGRTVDVVFHDHVVIARQGHFSMRAERLI